MMNNIIRADQRIKNYIKDNSFFKFEMTKEEIIKELSVFINPRYTLRWKKEGNFLVFANVKLNPNLYISSLKWQNLSYLGFDINIHFTTKDDPNTKIFEIKFISKCQEALGGIFSHKLNVIQTGKLYPKQINFKKVWTFKRMRKIIFSKKSKIINYIYNKFRIPIKEKILRNPIDIQYLYNPDPDLQYIALINDPRTYWYIHERSQEAVNLFVKKILPVFNEYKEQKQLLFLNNYAWFIQFIHNPTNKQKIASLFKRPKNIEYKWFKLNDEIYNFLIKDLGFDLNYYIYNNEFLQLKFMEGHNRNDFSNSLRIENGGDPLDSKTFKFRNNSFFKHWIFGNKSGPILIDLLDDYDFDSYFHSYSTKSEKSNEKCSPLMKIAAIKRNPNLINKIDIENIKEQIKELILPSKMGIFSDN